MRCQPSPRHSEKCISDCRVLREFSTRVESRTEVMFLQASAGVYRLEEEATPSPQYTGCDPVLLTFASADVE